MGQPPHQHSQSDEHQPHALAAQHGQSIGMAAIRSPAFRFGAVFPHSHRVPPRNSRSRMRALWQYSERQRVKRRLRARVH